MMRSILALFSVIVHVVTAGKSFITLLDDDVSSQPLCHTEDLLVCQKAQVDVKVFMKNNVITFPPNITMKKTKSSIEKTGTKVIQLRDIDGKSSMGLITITIENFVILKVDTVHGKTYDLVNCGLDCYLWRTINATFFDHLDFSRPALNRTEFNRKLDPAIAQLMEESRQSNAQVVITIKIYYTRALWTITPNLLGVIENKIAETNAVMQNSYIPITIRGICPQLMDVSESGNARQFTNRIELYRPLNQLYDGADLAMLMTVNCRPGACGFASTINVINTGGIRLAWSPTFAGPSYIFAHELGHLLGGEHDRTELGCGFRCSGTAHGYLIHGLRYVTVMAYEPDGGQYEVIPYFSSPNIVSRNGLAFGTPVDDVRSTILSLRFAISRLGNDQCQRWCFNRVNWQYCFGWRELGYCENTSQNFVYMRENCALSCGFC
ncbi:uncharacterized protein LOC131877672 [Tigriopus californicus]|uniref:uncharacterized protein LOC131877672 n=1 Tax=Tigriopus californicus TaxID=6832 RepID=UPI0027DA933A|nr:uncharacterized protein LOC131877672 [Tigriopus californicus]